MATIKSTIAPQSAVARFVASDIKGGETAHNYRMSVIATAILEGYKGNPNNIAEAKVFSAGKSRKAKAYQAAFTALPTITKLPYVGKWDAACNADIRAQAAALCKDAEFAFESAYLSTIEAAALEAAANKPTKPAPDAPAVVQAALQAAAQGEQEQAVDIGAAVEAVAMAVQQGMLEADEVVLLRAALAAYDAVQEGEDVALSTLLSRTPVLMMAQAA
jgi:hypothetical protein